MYKKCLQSLQRELQKIIDNNSNEKNDAGNDLNLRRSKNKLVNLSKILKRECTFLQFNSFKQKICDYLFLRGYETAHLCNT